jgi:hypothetical protein
MSEDRMSMRQSLSTVHIVVDPEKWRSGFRGRHVVIHIISQMVVEAESRLLTASAVRTRIVVTAIVGRKGTNNCKKKFLVLSKTLTRLSLVVQQYRGKLEEAYEMYGEVLAIRKRVLGVEYPDTLVSVNNLALVVSDRGKLEEAEQIWGRCRNVRSWKYCCEAVDVPAELDRQVGLADNTETDGAYCSVSLGPW